MSTLQAALALAAKGCFIFPIRTGSKKPAIRSWPTLATTDPDKIRQWWTRWPDANIGIHTCGLFVLDIDGPVGQASLIQLQERYPLPPTLRILSGNRSEPHHYQLLFRLPRGSRALNKPLRHYPGFDDLSHIDVRSTRGQIVGPGSVHATGGTYRWDTEPANVYADATEAPQWALDAFCKAEEARGPAAATATHREPAEGLREPGCDEEPLEILRHRFPITEPGQRQGRLASAVGWMASKRLPAERILSLATSWLGSYRDVYTTPYHQSLKELHALIYRTRKNIANGKFLLPPDHEILTAKQDLVPEFTSWLHLLVHSFTQQQEQQRAPNVWCSHRLYVYEERFVEALLLHYQYNLQEIEEGRFLMTDRQLMAVHQNRFGQKLSWNRLAGMKKKFFTRRSQTGELRRASLRELVVLVRPGVLGKPSVYRAKGLPALPATRQNWRAALRFVPWAFSWHPASQEAHGAASGRRTQRKAKGNARAAMCRRRRVEDREEFADKDVESSILAAGTVEAQ